jgi:hypothetical protein
MNRQDFIAAGAALAAASGAAGALAATPLPGPTPMPGSVPSGAPLYRNRNFGPTSELGRMGRMLGRMIAALQDDQNTYAGHKDKAIGYLQQALDEVNQMIAMEPSPTPTI